MLLDGKKGILFDRDADAADGERGHVLKRENALERALTDAVCFAVLRVHAAAAREVDATAELNARDEARAKRKARQRGERARKIRDRNER